MRSFVLGIAIFICCCLVTHETWAAHGLLHFSRVKHDGGKVVTAEIRNVADETREFQRGDTKRAVTGYSFDLHVNEVIYGDVVGDVLRIDFSAAGYANNWEFDRRPKNQMKVIAYLMPNDSGKAVLYGYPNAVEEIADFDSSAVEGVKKIFALWSMADIDKQIATLKKGCLDTNPRYQSWCLQSLKADGWWSRGAQDIAKHFPQEDVRPILIKVFSQEKTPLSTVVTCSMMLAEDEAFQSSDLRFDVLKRHLDNVVAQPEINVGLNNRLNWLLHQWAQSPNRTEELFSLIKKYGKRENAFRWSIVISSRDCYRFGNEPFNQTVLKYLREQLASDDEQIADGAAIAVTGIARATAPNGEVPREVLFLLKHGRQPGEPGYGRLLAGLGELEEIRKRHRHVFLQRTIKGHTAPVYSIAYSIDGKTLASASEDDTIRLWDAESGEEIRLLIDTADGVSPIAFSRQGKLLAVPDNRRHVVTLWDIETFKPVRELDANGKFLHSIAFSNTDHTGDTRLAIGLGDGSINVYYVSSGKLLQTLEGHNAPVDALSFASNWRFLASAGRDGKAQRWDLKSGKIAATTLRKGSMSPTVALSPDHYFELPANARVGYMVSAWSDGQIFFDAPYSAIEPFRPHEERVTAIAVDSHGELMATAGADKMIKIWRVTAGRRQLELKGCLTLLGHAGPVRSIAFSPTSTMLASGSEDNTIRLWEVPDDPWRFEGFR